MKIGDRIMVKAGSNSARWAYGLGPFLVSSIGTFGVSVKPLKRGQQVVLDGYSPAFYTEDCYVDTFMEAIRKANGL